MRLLRILFRLAALTGVTLATHTCLLAGAAWLGTVRGGGWAGPATAGWRTRIFHRWSRMATRILGIRVTVEGRPPNPPFILVSNHLGYIDVVVYGAQMECVFVSKAEVADWPIMGTLTRSADTLFIKRENKRDIPRVIREIETVLGTKRGIVMFPEGTSGKGDVVMTFRPSLLEPAAAAGLPVSYAALSYRTPAGSPPAHEAVCWWGGMPFVGHVIGLLGLPRIDATLRFGPEPIVEQDRKLLASRLQSAVETELQQVI